MSRIVTNGFEMNSATSGLEGETSTVAPTIENTIVHSGDCALRIDSLVSGVDKWMRFFYAGSASLVDYYARAYLYIVTLPSAQNAIIRWGSAAPHLAWITLDSGGLLRLFDEDGQIGSASSALSTDTWYRIEMRFNTAPAAGSMIVAARVDGTEFATSSTRSISGGGTNFRVGGNLLAEAQTQGDWIFDDVAVNNASGSVENTYPGEGWNAYMHPNAAGDNAMGSRGGTDSGSDWGQVDEITPNDATDYYILDANNDILDVNLEPSADRGIGPNDTIKLVEVIAQISSLTAASASHRLRIKSQASGTVFEPTTTTYALTTWAINDDVNPRRGHCVSYTDPQGGGPWTPALLDTAQIGIIATDAAPDVLVSALMAIVEYIPAVAAPPGVKVVRQAVQRAATR